MRIMSNAAAPTDVAGRSLQPLRSCQAAVKTTCPVAGPACDCQGLMTRLSHSRVMRSRTAWGWRAGWARLSSRPCAGVLAPDYRTGATPQGRRPSLLVVILLVVLVLFHIVVVLVFVIQVGLVEDVVRLMALVIPEPAIDAILGEQLGVGPAFDRLAT